MNSIGTLRSHAILQVGRVFKRSSQPVPRTMLEDEAGSKQNHRQFLVFPTTYSDLKINFGKLLQNSFRRIIQTTNWTNFFTKPPNILKCSNISALRRTISLTSDGINTTNKAWKYHDSVIIQRKWNKNEELVLLLEYTGFTIHQAYLIEKAGPIWKRNIYFLLCCSQQASLINGFKRCFAFLYQPS